MKCITVSASASSLLLSMVCWGAGCSEPSDADDGPEATQSTAMEDETGAGGSSVGTMALPTTSGTGGTSSTGSADSTGGTEGSVASSSSDEGPGTLTLGEASSSGGSVGNGTPFDESCQEWCEALVDCGTFPNESSCRWACEYSLVVHAEWSEECADALQGDWTCIASVDACDQSACSNDLTVQACAPLVGAAAEEYCMRRQACGLDTLEELESCTYGAGAFFEGLLAFEPCPAAQDAYLDCLTAVSCDELDARAMGVGPICGGALNEAIDICVDASGL